MPNRFFFLAALILCVAFPNSSSGQRGPVSQSDGFDQADPKDRIDILLLGDSTVIGSVPRKMLPEADHLEGIVRKLLDGEGDLPPVRVANEGRGGEYVQGLFEKRYDKMMKAHPKVDIVSIRYGLNDKGKREDFEDDFKGDLVTLIKRLRKERPGVKVFIETVIVYFDEEDSALINDRVRAAAEETGAGLIDQYARTAWENEQGNTALTYHRAKEEAIPKEFRALLPEPWTPGEICVLDNTLDAHLRDVPGWFADKHPNLAGYHIIGNELAKTFKKAIRGE